MHCSPTKYVLKKSRALDMEMIYHSIMHTQPKISEVEKAEHKAPEGTNK